MSIFIHTKKCVKSNEFSVLFTRKRDSHTSLMALVMLDRYSLSNKIRKNYSRKASGTYVSFFYMI